MVADGWTCDCQEKGGRNSKEPLKGRYSASCYVRGLATSHSTNAHSTWEHPRQRYRTNKSSQETDPPEQRWRQTGSICPIPGRAICKEARCSLNWPSHPQECHQSCRCCIGSLSSVCRQDGWLFPLLLCLHSAQHHSYLWFVTFPCIVVCIDRIQEAIRLSVLDGVSG